MSRKIIQVIPKSDSEGADKVLADDGTVWVLVSKDGKAEWKQIDLPALPPDPIVVARNERINKALESYYSSPKCPICGCRVLNEMDICDNCKDTCPKCGNTHTLNGTGDCLYCGNK